MFTQILARYHPHYRIVSRVHRQTCLQLFFLLSILAIIYHSYITTFKVFFLILEILYAESIEFDILAFTETWLSPMHNTDDLILQSYKKPERKDRVGDSHGGVILYIKEGIHYKRREDLEIRDIASIWIEVANKHKHILFGVFYRPPSADANYSLDIENSLYLAVDTDISDIIVTGDFNLNVLNPQMSRKIDSLCTQFSLYQSINQPTHFTEHSSSLIDILLVNNKDQLIVNGVGDPFLHQDVRLSYIRYI